MRKITHKTILVAALIGIGAIAHASGSGGFAGAQNTQTGGFAGPSANATAVITVEQAKTMRDDARVILQGNIIEQLGNDEYMFRDKTGTIRVDIDHDKWAGQTVKPEHLVEIRGEVDKDWNSIEVDVKTIRIIQ